MAVDSQQKSHPFWRIARTYFLSPRDLTLSSALIVFVGIANTVIPFLVGMAVDLIENELYRRGMSREAIAEHAQKKAAWVTGSDGKVLRCAFCDSPAVVQNWSWFRAWGRIPIFPKKIPRCGSHTEGRLVEKAELEADY